jgi:hypothetical protein
MYLHWQSHVVQRVQQCTIKFRDAARTQFQRARLAIRREQPQLVIDEIEPDGESTFTVRQRAGRQTARRDPQRHAPAVIERAGKRQRDLANHL